MSGILRLVGEWQVRGFVGEEWRWHVGKPVDAPGWLMGRVPGSVLDDLVRAGEVPDPCIARNSLLCEWVPRRYWVYRRWFTLGALEQGERAVVCFDGVDHEVTVLLDGVEVARHSGMFRPFEADVTDLVGGGGEHLLAVVLHPAPDVEPQVGRTERVRVHRARLDHGWDFCPPMVHQGIWREVRVECGGPVRLRSATASTGLDGPRRGTVRVEAGLAAAGAVPDGTEVTVRLRDGDRVLAGASRPVAAGGTRAVVELAVAGPRLWWPNGAGPQHLYEVEAELAAPGARPQARRMAVGFRRLELLPNEGADHGTLPYTFTVNGERLYANGWNWVPLDAQYGAERPGRLAHLLQLARDAHVNLVRVWGGGLVETEEFYDLCDRLGIMVWQEFALSSSAMGSTPAEDREFVAAMEREARAVVPPRRRHPSLAVWCGGNELQDGKGRPLDESAPVLRALRDTVNELDPDRAWLPSSPSGPVFLNRADTLADHPGGLHDVHGPWEHQGLAAHQPLYDAGSCLLHSEFGVEGMTNRRTLERLIPDPAQRMPAHRGNPVYAHLGAWWNNEPLVREAFGGHPVGLDELRRASQHLQYDGLRYAVEANRRRAFRSSGTLPWQFNESYPNAWCTAAVDHRGDPKPAYHGVRRAYRPLHVCAAFPGPAWGGQEEVRAEVWAWTSRPLPPGCLVTARIVDAEGREAAAERWPWAPAERGRPVRYGSVAAPAAGIRTEVFLLDLAVHDGDGALLAANRYPCSRTADLAPLLDLAPARVAAAAREAGPDRTRLRLRHTAGPAALGLVLEDDRPYGAPGWAVFEENVIDLLPGEEAEVDVVWRGTAPSGPVRLSGWNTEACHVR